VGLKLVGEPVPVAERVGSTPRYGNFSVSTSGVLAYRTGSSGTMQLTWLDREGKVLGLAGEPGRRATLLQEGSRSKPAAAQPPIRLPLIPAYVSNISPFVTLEVYQLCQNQTESNRIKEFS